MGMNRASKNDQNFIAFCDELRAYVEAHHLFPPKHTTLNNKCRYVRKKINEGKLEGKVDDAHTDDDDEKEAGSVVSSRSF